MASGSKLVLYGALCANLAIAATKFLAAAVTGSSALLSEGIHSVVDTGNSSLLLLGQHRAKRPPDDRHQFGHGKELYFWTLIVAILIFAVGGGMSIYEGILHLLNPVELSDPTWNYVVLSAGVLFEGTTWTLAYRQMRRAAAGRGLWQTLRASKDPAVFTVLLEDSAALTGLAIAFFGVWLSHRTGTHVFDGLASILIGTMLCAVAVLLVHQSRGLIVGEGLDRATRDEIRRLVEADADVEQARTPLTMHFGPNEVLLGVELRFREALSAEQIAAAVERLEAQVRQSHPEVRHIYVEACSLRAKPASGPDASSAAAAAG